MADEKLRIYKHGSASYNDITSATVGGFSELTVTKVRNTPGALEFTLGATTAGIVAGWLDEASTIELWMDGAKKDIFIVDDYDIDWSASDCRVKCVGLLILGRDSKYTGSFTGVSAKSALQILIGQVSRWVWDTALVATGATIDNINYEDKSVDEAIQEICLLAGFNFWFSADYKFHAGAIPTAIDQTFELNANCRDFGTTYTARDIINRVVLATGAGTFTYNDTDSQADYGVKAQKITKTWIASETQAASYAAKILAYSAFPKQEISISVDYDDMIAVGQLAEITGLSDGRTYEELIQQSRWSLGDLNMELLIGSPPLSLAEGIDPAPATEPPGTPDEPPGNEPPDEVPIESGDVPWDGMPADTVGTDELQDDAVGTDEIQDESVTPAKVTETLKSGSIIWVSPGEQTVAPLNGEVQLPACEVVQLIARRENGGSNPTGADLIFEIHEIDVASIGTVTIAAGEALGQSTPTYTISTNSFVRSECTQIGSTTPGEKITVQMKIRKI